MPILTVKVVKGVVLTNDAQKRELEADPFEPLERLNAVVDEQVIQSDLAALRRWNGGNDAAGCGGCKSRSRPAERGAGIRRYSERRKLRMSCFCPSERASKRPTTPFASEAFPARVLPLWWACTASSRSEVRPS